MSNRVFLESW